MGKAKGHWEHYTIFKVDPNGQQRLLTDYVSDTHYTYIPASLPGNPQAGDRVSLYFPKKSFCPYTRCAVGEQEYRSLGPYRGWELVIPEDTQEQEKPQ